MRGFVFTLEALAALVSLVSVLLLLQAPVEDYSQVIVYKQASDIANALVRFRDFSNATAMAGQVGLRVRVTACGEVVADQRPADSVRAETFYYDGEYCSLVVEASRQ